MVFAYCLPSGGSKIDQKSIKIASQSGLKLRCRKNTQKSSEMVPKMTQHGAQLGPFGGSFGSKKSLKNETQKKTQKRGPGLYGKRAGGPLETHKFQTSDHQKMHRTRPGVLGGTVADVVVCPFRVVSL